MNKSEILKKLYELNRLKRELEDLAKELNIGEITEDKIYISIIVYHSILNNLLKESDD